MKSAPTPQQVINQWRELQRKLAESDAEGDYREHIEARIERLRREYGESLANAAAATAERIRGTSRQGMRRPEVSSAQ